jgi:5'-nucleotidase
VIRRKLVKELPNGLKVGLFGVLGAKAWGVAYGLGGLTFDDEVAVAQALVKELREQDGVDLVICVAHSGLSADGKGPDAELATKAPGIDVIVGGHSHTLLAQPVVVGGTIIVQAGAYGEQLGRLELDVVDGKASVEKFSLLPVDDTVAGDAQIQQAVQGYIAEVDKLLVGEGLSYSEVLAATSFDLAFPEFQEAILGNLITDAYRHAADAVAPTAPADLALDSTGVIGDPILKGKTGKIGFADLHRAVKAGYGPDGKIGFPLVSFYLTGKEIRDGMEVVAVAQDVLLTHDYFLQLSGVQMEFSKAGGLFQRVTSVKIGDPPAPIDPAACYKVVTNLLVGRWLGRVKDATFGALTVEAKDEDCKTLITDLSTRIIDADPAQPGVQELKAYRAVASYLQSMPDTTGDGIPDVPASYATAQGRIVAKP